MMEMLWALSGVGLYLVGVLSGILLSRRGQRVVEAAVSCGHCGAEQEMPGWVAEDERANYALMWMRKHVAESHPKEARK